VCRWRRGTFTAMGIGEIAPGRRDDGHVERFTWLMSGSRIAPQACSPQGPRGTRAQLFAPPHADARFLLRLKPQVGIRSDEPKHDMGHETRPTAGVCEPRE